MKLPTVAELRQQGWKVGVIHRHYDPAKKTHLSVQERRLSPQGRDIGPGWYTGVTITPPGKERHFHGEACCNPRDAYDRRLGLTIALGLALKAYGWKGKAA